MSNVFGWILGSSSSPFVPGLGKGLRGNRSRLTREKPTLQAYNLDHAYGEAEMQVVTLREVSIDLCRGQFALLMGPNGCGKTTLWKILSGLLQPSSGRVTALGEDLWGLTEPERIRFRWRHLGFVFQKPDLWPALTARQQLEMLLRWGDGASSREARRRADEVLDQLGLDQRIQRLRPAELSGGQQQRVALGRALIKNPPLLFADEPTAALDWEHGRQVIELLRSIAHDRGATVLVISHDARMIPYADRVFQLGEGRLVEETPRAPTANSTVRTRCASCAAAAG
jgi:putative ABC transport system ATP-binding protein